MSNFFNSKHDKIFNKENKLKKVKKSDLSSKIEELYLKLSDRNFSKFVDIIASPRRIFLRSFFAGIARGIGTAIGFSILGAILIYLLRHIVMLNLPVIGKFMKEIWDIIQKQ